ncbi:histidine kinase [Massilia solisilvae]|uniref:histidine kinase n=1 Tax=Massilia solisilvae TaxID=1811225 RepID=A0ABT2BLU2_9BURK|nr:histidine kinase [Massilia solisilvae]MCS0609489.1 histidine kinase [Massilia solisilvae]
MPAFWIRRDSVAAAAQSDAADEQIIARIRLVLTVAAFLSAAAAAPQPDGVLLWLLGAYMAMALGLFLAAEAEMRLSFQRALHWFDLLWCFLFLNVGSFDPGDFLRFFLFAILSAGLRQGFDEGAKIALVAATGYGISTLNNLSEDNLSLIFVRTVFICALGYLIAQLGEQRLQLRRRIALLRALAQPSNARLGIDHTVTAMMEGTRAFFAADRCVLVLGAPGKGWTVRTVQAGGPLAVPAVAIDPDAAQPFLAVPDDGTILYRRRRLARLLPAHPHERRHWRPHASLPCERVADLLEADNFISAPVVLAEASGRVYVSRASQPYTRSDALFLSQAVAQAMPVAEHVALLDRIASEAASNERQRLALNMHDTAVQPYIGLALGLAALRLKVPPDNPIAPELDALAGMVQSVIADLRDFAGSVANRAQGDQAESLCSGALARLAVQMRERYGLTVRVDVQKGMELGDRLAAEVIQIVREGLNNIGKHTAAREGVVRVRRADRKLSIEIDNVCAEGAVGPFVPHSIRQRAAVLGGQVHVHRASSATAVCVEIPI